MQEATERQENLRNCFETTTVSEQRACSYSVATNRYCICEFQEIMASIVLGAKARDSQSIGLLSQLLSTLLLGPRKYKSAESGEGSEQKLVLRPQ